MKKFIVLTYGYTPPTDEIKQTWGAWFGSVGPQLVDPGSPFVVASNSPTRVAATST